MRLDFDVCLIPETNEHIYMKKCHYFFEKPKCPSLNLLRQITDNKYDNKPNIYIRLKEEQL